MKPVTFQMKNNLGVTEYRFIAQEVQPVFPELVMAAKDASKTLSMNYVGMVFPMVKAMQEFKLCYDALEKNNSILKCQVAAPCAASKVCH